jgi:site-specific recombinase XerD
MASVWHESLEYIADRRRRGYARSTITRMRSVQVSLCHSVGNQTPLRKVQRPQLEQWMGSRDLTPRTLATELSYLRSFFAWCILGASARTRRSDCGRCGHRDSCHGSCLMTSSARSSHTLIPGNE